MDFRNKSADEILRHLKQAGFKFTGKRRAIVDLFVQHRDKYLSAKEVFDEVRQQYPNVSFDTIYRTLALLVDQWIIETMEFNEDAARYRLTCRDEHHHHVICLGCGRTFALDQCPMEELDERIKGFKTVSHRFEVYGYCDKCLNVS